MPNNQDDLNRKLNYLNETKQEIKRSLKAKGQPVNDNTTFREYANLVNNITTGTDTDDADATPNDIISPKTAYVNNEKITGSIIPTYIDITSIEVNSTEQLNSNIQYVGNNYFVRKTSSSVTILKLINNTLTKINVFNFSIIASSIEGFNYSCYFTETNDIRFVISEGSTFTYLRFDCSTNTFIIVGNVEGARPIADRYQIFFPSTKNNFAIVVCRRVSRDYQAVYKLTLTNTSISITNLYNERAYNSEVTNIHFANNDLLFCMTGKNIAENRLAQFWFVLDNTGNLQSLQYSSTEEKDLILSESGTLGYLNNKLYNITYSNGIPTQKELIQTISSSSFKDFYAIDFVQLNNNGTHQIYSINDLTTPIISTTNTIIKNKNQLGILELETTTVGMLIENLNHVGTQIINSLTRENEKYYRVTDINLTADQVLNGNTFVNNLGKNYRHHAR